MRLKGIFISTSIAGSLVCASPKVSIDVPLSPAGSFTALTTEINGSATMNGSEVSASNVIVKLANLDTGIELRNKHAKQHLAADKFPEVVLVSATGKDGVGEGLIRIKGIERKISGSYSIEGSELTAVFPIHLPDFDIKDIRYMGVGAKDEIKLTVTLPILK